MRRLWAGCLTLTLAGWVGSAAAQGLRWQPAPAAPPAVTLGPPVAASVSGPPRPVARGQSPDDGYRASPPWSAAAYEPDAPGGIAPLRLPVPPGPVTPTSMSVEYPPAPPPPAPPPPPSSRSPADDLLPGLTDRRRDADRRDRKRTSRFGDWLQGWVGEGCGGCFESDHAFDSFISPVSNPFLFEDPRSLTEARPLFLYQTIPNSNPLFRGGNAEFFGTQFRLALTDRWSVVINKLGGVSFNPGDDGLLPSDTGFAEFWLGPKYTFIRNCETGTLAAAGVTFQIPTGPAKVYQDTGKLSVVPYVTAAQNFGQTGYGSFNVMDTFGYAFRADGQRSDYFFNSIHLDFDVCNWHRIYPLLELHWFHYTRSGGARDFGFEGADLANFGSTGVSGRDNLTIAPGVRYKFSEHVQTGLAVEFPLNGTRDIKDFRLGIDLIFRY